MPLKATEPTLDELAAICLNHLAQNPEQLAEFMGISGLTPASLRQSVRKNSFARGLIDYVVQNEPLLLAICADAAIKPESIMRVWAKLNPGG